MPRCQYFFLVRRSAGLVSVEAGQGQPAGYSGLPVRLKRRESSGRVADSPVAPTVEGMAQRFLPINLLMLRLLRTKMPSVCADTERSMVPDGCVCLE